MLGPEAVKILSDNISHLLDEGGKEGLDQRKDLEESWAVPTILNKIKSYPVIGDMAKNWYLDRMSLSYDCAVSFILAQEESLRLVESLMASGKDDKIALETIESEINGNRIEGQTFIRNLRKQYPGVYKAVSTTQAIRSLLNYESKTIERLQKRGRIDNGEAARMMSEIDKRNKQLQKHPPLVDSEAIPDDIK